MPAGENPTKIPPALKAALRRGATLLTPNQRSARALRRAYDEAMLAEGLEQWASATVLPLDTWLTQLWHGRLLDGSETRLLLNRTQEHALWRTIVEADPEVPGLRSADGLALMAVEAWNRLCQFEGSGRLREFAVSTDTRAFERWAREFERRCQRLHALPLAQLAGQLTAAFREQAPTLAGVLLVDFDELTPAIAALLDVLRAGGVAVDEVQTGGSSAGWLAAAEDEPSEIRAAAEWCRQHLLARPQAQLAVVVPSLEGRRAEMERVFAEVLAPEAEPITARPQAPRFEFSLGRPLAATAVCASALLLLRWTLRAISLEDIGSLLLSPLVGGAGAEGRGAAQFDTYTLRRAAILRPELTLDGFLHLLRQADLPDLSRRLHAMRRAAGAEHLGELAPDHQTYAEWTDAFRNVLAAAGWTAAAQRDSLSFQAQRRWESVLDEVATLDFDGRPPDAREVLEQVTRLAGETIFAPESRNAPVQIIGPLELGAVPFDALWLLGADDLSWPAIPAPHPLLPYAVQRALSMPGADPARDQARAQRLTERIAGAAGEVVFSYARHGEEGARRPSPLLAGLHLTPLDSMPQPTPPTTAAMEVFADTAPIPPLPDRVIRGGATILQLQAACPFRAFAERRLFSAEPEQKDTGFDPRERGNLVHRVMELFWGRVEHQPALQALSQGEQHTVLDECIEAALSRSAAGVRSPWEAAYLNVQAERLHRLLTPWLEFEAARPVFAVRQQENDGKDLRIGRLRLDLRVDRVDETEGGLLILDYKTGSATPSEWLSDRPDQPQLPLYAVLSENPVAGVAFALLKPGEGLDLKGFAADDRVLDRIARNMPLPMEAQVEEWRRVLTELAEDFYTGRAAVDPKCYPGTCERCSQRILCRLDATTLDDTGDEAEQSLAEVPVA